MLMAMRAGSTFWSEGSAWIIIWTVLGLGAGEREALVEIDPGGRFVMGASGTCWIGGGEWPGVRVK